MAASVAPTSSLCTACCGTRTVSKMSKSRGNTVDPIAWMDTYGTDAMRFTFARGANPGRTSRSGRSGSREHATSATSCGTQRFALINGASTSSPLPPRELLRRRSTDLVPLQQVIAEVDANYDDFQFAAAETLYHFAWDEFCDWYVELAKVSIAHGGDEAANTRLVLGHALDACCACCIRSRRTSPRRLWTS